MLTTLSVIAPIFALVFSGWLLRRSGVVGDQATLEMNKFVVYLALPALLFDIIANASWQVLWQPSFILCFSLSTFFLLALVYGIQRYRRIAAADSAVDALNASYANTGFMGFPLLLSVLGEGSLTPTLIATIITICIQFAVGIILVEIGLQKQSSPLRLLQVVSIRVLKNPLIIAPLAASVFPSFGWTVPNAGQTFLDLLGGAAAPCALVTLGLFLGNKPKGESVISPTTVSFTAIKLIAHPFITWLLAVYVFALPPYITYCAVLVAALPTGTGPFMLAKFYNREAMVTSGTILLSTALSPLTLIIMLTVFPVPQG